MERKFGADVAWRCCIVQLKARDAEGSFDILSILGLHMEFGLGSFFFGIVFGHWVPMIPWHRVLRPLFVLHCLNSGPYIRVAQACLLSLLPLLPSYSSRSYLCSSLSAYFLLYTRSLLLLQILNICPPALTVTSHSLELVL